MLKAEIHALKRETLVILQLQHNDIFKGHKFTNAPDLNEFQTQNKSKTLIHPDQLYPIHSMISGRTVPSMFFSQFDFAITHSTKANP